MEETQKKREKGEKRREEMERERKQGEEVERKWRGVEILGWEEWSRSQGKRKVFFLNIAISSFLMFFVEPIMDGAFSFFIFFCFNQGMIYEYMKKMQITSE